MFKCANCGRYTLRKVCKCGERTQKVGYKFKFKFLDKK